MLSLKGTDVFALAKRIKAKYENVPIVVLTYFSREGIITALRERI